MGYPGRPSALRAHLSADNQLPYPHPVLEVVFGIPKDLDARNVDLRSKIVGTRDPKTSLQFVSTFRYDLATRVVTVFLAKSRMDEFIQKGFEVALVNTSVWRVQTGKVKCADMDVIGDLDGEIEGKQLKRPKVRALSSKERSGWMDEMMGGMGGMGGIPGLGGFPGMGGGAPGMGSGEDEDPSQMLGMLQQMMASMGMDQEAMTNMMGGR